MLWNDKKILPSWNCYSHLSDVGWRRIWKAIDLQNIYPNDFRFPVFVNHVRLQAFNAWSNSFVYAALSGKREEKHF